MTQTNVQPIPSNSQHHDTPNNKTHVIKFRVTAEEKASLELTCKLLNLSLSTFIRRAMHRLAKADFPNRKQIVHEILHPEDRPAPQSSYSHYSGINYSALEVAVRRIQQDFDFLMRYLPKLPDDSYAKTETLKILKQHKAYMAQFEELLNDEKIA